MSQKPIKTFADTLPVYFRRSCSAISGDGGFRPWLDAKFGAGKWILGEYPRGDAEIALTDHVYADLAVEYGYQRLSGIFASLDPIGAASTFSSHQLSTPGEAS